MWYCTKFNAGAQLLQTFPYPIALMAKSRLQTLPFKCETDKNIELFRSPAVREVRTLPYSVYNDIEEVRT